MKDQDLAALQADIHTLERGLQCWSKIQHNVHYDKTGFGFNLDPRFAACKIDASLDTWCGTYGNSSCSRILSDLGSAFRVAFIEELNHQIEPLLTRILQRLRKTQRTYQERELTRLHTEIAAVESWSDSEDATALDVSSS